MSGTTRWPEMETERLHLRPFTAGDAAAIHRAYSDPEVMRYVAGGPVADLAGTEAMLREYGEHQEAFGFSFWAVIERASDEVIGDAGLYLFEGRGPEIELGYTIGCAGGDRGTPAKRRAPGSPPPSSGSDSTRSSPSPTHGTRHRFRPREDRHASRRAAHGVWPRTPALQTSGRLS